VTCYARGLLSSSLTASLLRSNLSEHQLSVSNLSERQLSEDFLLSKICIGSRVQVRGEVGGTHTREAEEVLRLEVLIQERLGRLRLGSVHTGRE